MVEASENSAGVPNQLAELLGYFIIQSNDKLGKKEEEEDEVVEEAVVVVMVEKEGTHIIKTSVRQGEKKKKKWDIKIVGDNNKYAYVNK